MPPLLDLLQPGKLHWLTTPRYAVISLPLLLASGSGMAGYGQVALLLLLHYRTGLCAAGVPRCPAP